MQEVFFLYLQIAWALNKGIKSEFKQYWDVEIGVTYIPWSKIKAQELEILCEGGMLDNDTMSPGKHTFLIMPTNIILSMKSFSCIELFYLSDWKNIIKKPEKLDTPQNGSTAESARNENLSPAAQATPMPLSLQVRPLMPVVVSAYLFWVETSLGNLFLPSLEDLWVLLEHVFTRYAKYIPYISPAACLNPCTFKLPML